jgi:hypothetical protein
LSNTCFRLSGVICVRMMSPERMAALDGGDELVFVRGHAERHEVRADVGRDFVQRVLRVLAGGLAPLDGLLRQKGQHVGAFHQRGFFGVDHRQEGRHGFALVQRHLHVMQQLREHGVAGVFAGVLGLEPDFVGLDVDQALGVALEAQRLDVGVLDVFFAAGGLELGCRGSRWGGFEEGGWFAVAWHRVAG